MGLIKSAQVVIISLLFGQSYSWSSESNTERNQDQIVEILEGYVNEYSLFEEVKTPTFFENIIAEINQA